MVPHTEPASPIEPRAGRLAATIRSEPEGCAIALLGLPDDTGVGLNSGRVGASEGPAAFRRALASFGTTFDAAAGRALDVAIYDAGDVRPAEASDPARALLATHDRVSRATLAIHEMGMIPVCVGGGHDLTRATVRALADHAGGAVGGLNVDAHLDVRDSIGSGMPYRFLIEEGHLDARRFVELGIGRHACDREHVEYLVSRGARITGVEAALDRPEETAAGAFGAALGDDRPGFVSIDLDGIDASQAPGVSAPNPMGLPVRTAVDIARRAGMTPAVRHFDVMELNPVYDVDGRTARIAALLVLSFIAGFAERSS